MAISKMPELCYHTLESEGGESVQKQDDHNRQKKLAVINDFCGFGRCSIAAALPVISAMHVQCCPLPTAVFSDHTGFESFYRVDFTQHMARYSAEWEKLGLRFDGIATGYLGSARQIDLVKDFLARFKTKETKVLIDPVMGDYGSLYPSFTQELAGRMHELMGQADLLTPNLTEACILAGLPYREEFSQKELEALCERLSESGPSSIVVSGLHFGDEIGNFVWSGGKAELLTAKRVGLCRSGTGDVFSAILAADLVNGVALKKSVQKAADFISKTMAYTLALGVPETDGICFEEYLWELGKETAT